MPVRHAMGRDDMLQETVTQMPANELEAIRASEPRRCMLDMKEPSRERDRYRGKKQSREKEPNDVMVRGDRSCTRFVSEAERNNDAICVLGLGNGLGNRR